MASSPQALVAEAARAPKPAALTASRKSRRGICALMSGLLPCADEGDDRFDFAWPQGRVDRRRGCEAEHGRAGSAASDGLEERRGAGGAQAGAGVAGGGVGAPGPSA